MALRDSALDIAPPWLSDDSADAVGGKVVYLFGLLPDALVDKMQQGIYARLPLGGTTSPSQGNQGPYADALTHIGHDRLIPQGVGETPAAWGQRLQKAFTSWQTAGTAQSVMQQVLATLQTACRIAVVRAPCVLISNVDTVEPYATEYAANADPTLSPARWVPTAWLWDIGLLAQFDAGFWLNNYLGCPPSIQAAWWRNWLVLWPTDSNQWTMPGANWGDLGVNWGDTSRSWGLSVPPQTIALIVSVVTTFKSAGAWYQWIVIAFDDRFANWGSASAYYPTAGNWQFWSQIVFLPLENRYVYIPSRYPALRFCDGAT